MADLHHLQYYYKLERQRFACIAYSITAFFLGLSVFQWFIFHILKDVRHYFTENYWIGIIFFTISLVLTLVFIFFEKIRFVIPVNWIVAIVIIECIVFGVTPLIVRHYKYQILFDFLICAIVLFLFIVIGSYIKHDLTFDVVILVIFSIVCVIGAIYFLMLHIVANVPFSLFLHRLFITMAIVGFVMYHGQVINGGRFAEIRNKDYLLAALLLFYDFLLMFMLSFQFAPKWSDLCDTHKNTTSAFMIKYFTEPMSL